jgi:hypothetical protein
MKLRGRERRLISKASATGMSPLSPQGWVYGVFAFNLLSLTGIPGRTDDLLAISGDNLFASTTYLQQLPRDFSQ